MERFGSAIMKCLEVLIVAIISVMSILVIVNVALRFFFSSSIVISEELSRFLFIYIVFLGAIVAMKEDAHIYVDFIAKFFPRPIQWFLKTIVEFAMLGCCYVLMLGSWELTEYNMVDKSPVAGIPMGYIYFAGVVGAVGMGLVIIVRICKHFANFKNYFGPQADVPADISANAQADIPEDAQADLQAISDTAPNKQGQEE